LSVQLIEAPSWEDCQKSLTEIEARHHGMLPLWFRGHGSSNWTLQSTLERRAQNLVRVGDYYGLIRRIKPEIESYTGARWEFPEDTALQNWATEYDEFSRGPLLAYDYLVHLRHHGFPSPLIDWSQSQFVAAFFAFVAPQAETVAIYVYSARPHNIKVGGSDRPVIKELGPLVRTHQRHFRQRSGYTVCALWDANGWSFVPHEEVFKIGDQQQDLLWKITVPARERSKVLRQLDRYNLNPYSLFGSEEGLMETLAIREIDLLR